MKRGFFIIAGVVLLWSTAAEAYVGPGSGISALGSFFAVLAAVFFAIVGFVWYPVKRLIRTLRNLLTGKPGA